MLTDNIHEERIESVGEVLEFFSEDVDHNEHFIILMHSLRELTFS